MYSKVKKCLESMGYKFKEIERVSLVNGFALMNGFLVERPYYDKVYIEIYDTGCIVIWSWSDGRPLDFIFKSEDYIALFHLAYALSN